MQMWKAAAAICVGASLGALLRWQLGAHLNAVFPNIPLGTLAANLIGGYVVGLAVALFANLPGLAPEWRRLVITGFCGGLTTFSAFSAETSMLLQQGRVLWGGAAAVSALGRSLAETVAGILALGW